MSETDSFADITQLLPHRGSMLMLERIVAFGEEFDNPKPPPGVPGSRKSK